MVQITSTAFFAIATAALSVAAMPNAPVKKACTPMTNAELGALPGKNKIEAQAVQDHGEHSHNLVVNDPDFPGSPAQVCDNIATGWAWVEYDDSIDGHFKWSYKMDDLLTVDERRVA